MNQRYKTKYRPRKPKNVNKGSNAAFQLSIAEKMVKK